MLNSSLIKTYIILPGLFLTGQKVLTNYNGPGIERKGFPLYFDKKATKCLLIKDYPCI